MRYATVCSGIEAPSAAWHQLGWQPAWFSEIEPFPSAVLAHHYPNVPNRGDMTKFKEWPDDPVRLICAGTPCQSFSVAGLRKGLDDPRGNLTLVFLAILERTRPQWVVWENVPGVLSADGGRAFGSFLGGLAQLGYGCAYRVLDAQYFGVPQRRRRVFVVGYLGDWRRAAAVLFERHCLQGHPAPSREAGPRIADGTLSRALSRVGGGDDPGANKGAPIVITAATAPTLNGAGNRTGGDRPPGMQVDTVESLIVFGPGDQDVSHAVSSRDGKCPCSNLAQGTLVANSLNGNSGRMQVESTYLPTQNFLPQRVRIHGADGVAPTLASEEGRGHGVPTIAFDTTQITNINNRSNPKPGDPCHGLAAGTHPPAVAFSIYPEGGQGADLCATQVDGKKGSKKRTQSADGPRYKALGNSMAVPVVRWIGERIEMIDKIVLP